MSCHLVAKFESLFSSCKNLKFNRTQKQNYKSKLSQVMTVKVRKKFCETQPKIVNVIFEQATCIPGRSCYTNGKI